MSNQTGQTNPWITRVVRDALSSGSNSELLKALVEAFPGSWFFTRLDATFAHVNQRACDALGYTREELMSLTLYEVDPGLTRELWASLAALGRFNPRSVRTIHRRKDGSTFPVEAFGSRIVLDGEDVAVSYVVDLSEEALAREALAQKEHLLRSLLDEAPIMVWVVDADARLEVLEGSGVCLVGTDADLAIGKAVAEVYPELEAATRRALEGEPVDGVASLGEVHLTYRYVPRRDETGQVIGATGIAMDVTARRNAERANRRLLAAIEQSAESVILMDSRGKVEYVNPAFETTTGRKQADVLGKLWPALASSNSGAAAEELTASIGRGSGWRGTLQTVRTGKTPCIEHVTLSPLREAGGDVTGFVVVSRDMTEQVRTQERLRQAQKMDAIGQLAGGIAHDFNNLLQVILGNAHLCIAQGLAPEAAAMLLEIEQASERAARLVNQLLAFGRKESGEAKAIAVDAMVGRLMSMVRRLLGEHIVVELRLGDGPLLVRGDESQLEQVVINLCVNARDAMPEGGVLRIGVCSETLTDPSAQELGLRAGDYVVLEAADSGWGMSAEIQKRIFEPFFTTKDTRSGTGLGLATVYAVAERHGGVIDVQSHPGQGSVFRVYFPRCDAGYEETESPAGPRSTAERGCLVLLAEDDAAVRRVTRAYLEQAGHRVVVAQDGKEAIDAIHEYGTRLDLAIIDAIMPHASGPEVYRALRKVSAVPVLFVTGYEFNSLESLPEDPARTLLRKPFSAEELSEEVQRLRAEWRARQRRTRDQGS